jgi:CRP-like cAMP-binding protein
VSTQGDMDMRTSASVLHHAHVRLSRLVDSAPGRLPVAEFQPGDWICVEGERGKHVFMILEGEAEVREGSGH